jgi:uncharacterized membrane protein YdjX (TVP38/TMEM64 family)
VDAVARGIERAGSLRALIDERQSAEHTLVRIELPPEGEAPPSEALRAAADPDEPIGFASSVADLAPPVDTANRPRIPIVPAIALTGAVVSTSSALIARPEFQTLQDLLEAAPGIPSILWIGVGGFVLANFVLIPLELTTIAAGLLLGGLPGGLVALLGSLVAAAIGYLTGRAIGVSGLARWMSRRAYRSGRQLGARGVTGVIVLRLASVASAQSIHLLCGAERVPFATYMVGTVLGLAPAIGALSGLGALLRRALLYPSVSNAAITVGAALLLVAFAAGLRAFLLTRRFGPSVHSHRAQAEFG